MSPELDRRLCEDFPLLFADRQAPILESNMVFGFECGDGWEPLIRKAASELEQMIEAAGATEFKYLPRASQVKEKYGTLRFYLTHGNDKMFAIADKLEAASAKVCETCGKAGKLRGNGWLYTACNECTEKQGE